MRTSAIKESGRYIWSGVGRTSITRCSDIDTATTSRREKKAPDPAPPPPITTGLVEDHTLRHGIEAPDPPLLLPLVIEMLAIGVVLATAVPATLSRQRNEIFILPG
jgi:hypothetical protein